MNKLYMNSCSGKQSSFIVLLIQSCQKKTERCHIDHTKQRKHCIHVKRFEGFDGPDMS